MATSTIGSGKDYASITSWDSGTDGDLTGLGVVEGLVDEVRNDALGSFYSFAGGTNSSASDYRQLNVAAAYRHAGKWDSSKARITNSNNYPLVEEQFFRVINTQMNLSATSNARGWRTTQANIRFEQCIVYNTNNHSGSGGWYLEGGTDLLRNCVAHGGGYGVYFRAATQQADNCTFEGNQYGAHASSGGSSITVKNSYFAGGTTSVLDDTSFDWSVTTCAINDTAQSTGFTQSVAFSTANFTNVTSGSVDVHLVSGAASALRTGGTDLSGDFTTDIDGDTRVDWGIGADEFISGGGGGDSRGAHISGAWF